MCDAGVTLTRESICVTCLSQDRKLFPVNDSKSHVLFLDLSDGDKLCWECNFFVLKVAAFRSRAARAQALLASALHQTKVSTIKVKCLSRLRTSPVEVLGASLYTPDPLQVYVKAEPLKPVKEELQNKLYESPVEDTNSIATCDESDDETVNVTSLAVLKQRKEGRGEGRSDERLREDMGDIANASLKFLLNRKSGPIKTPNAKKFKNTTAVTVQIERVKDNEVTEVEDVKPSAPIDPDRIYTVTVLSEDEMLKWRERKKNTENYIITSIGGMSCKQCIEPFTSRKLYAAHARRHKEDYGPFACHICGLRSDTDKALGAHTAQHYRLLTCNVCGYEWDNANTMRRHCSDAHGVPVTVWDCDQCERQFPTQRQQSAHMICHRVVSCRECGKQVRQNNLKKHKMWHSGIPLRCCAVCGGQYRGDEGLATHMKTHDTKVDEAAFCAECNIQFRTMQLYRNHRLYTLKHARPEDMPFKCTLCGKSFLQRSGLKLHVDGVHSREPRHACRVCGEMLKTRVAKRNHERTKHEGIPPTRNKICDHCGKAFTNKSTLQDHINTHTGARPFACTLCDATFGYKSALYLHGRYKHKIKKKNAKKVEESTCAEQEQDT